jgi:hypothetical protein
MFRRAESAVSHQHCAASRRSRRHAASRLASHDVRCISAPSATRVCTVSPTMTARGSPRLRWRHRGRVRDVHCALLLTRGSRPSQLRTAIVPQEIEATRAETFGRDSERNSKEGLQTKPSRGHGRPGVGLQKILCATQADEAVQERVEWQGNASRFCQDRPRPPANPRENSIGRSPATLRHPLGSSRKHQRRIYKVHWHGVGATWARAPRARCAALRARGALKSVLAPPEPRSARTRVPDAVGDERWSAVRADGVCCLKLRR